jgi:hypothetical protein
MPSKSTRPQYGATGHAKQTGVNTPSMIYLDDTNGNQWALWFDIAGGLRMAEPAVCEAVGFNWNTGGTTIGGQTLLEAAKVDTPKTEAPKAKKSA